MKIMVKVWRPPETLFDECGNEILPVPIGKKHCIACNGTGRNSKGNLCSPCSGTGIQKEAAK